MSHVVPDLVQKVLKGQDPLHILGDGRQVRCYTYGGDLARGIRLAIESPAATNEDFNLSTARATTVLELAEAIWKKIKGPDEPLRVVSDQPFTYDVQKRDSLGREGPAAAGLRGDDDARRGARRDHPLDPGSDPSSGGSDRGRRTLVSTRERSLMDASPSEPVVDFVMPVYNEGANIARALEEIDRHVPLPKRVLVVYDFDEDNTVPVVRELQSRYPYVELVKNTLGRGVLNAVRAGIAATPCRGGRHHDGRPVRRPGRRAARWSARSATRGTTSSAPRGT